ncbi:hypothetical protein L9G74_06405 [Shewanella sp. C32]|uniref:Transcriptional regulator VspR n=1 Tax=Shewanella electrica TaxID=515560 RepID=A0ABT2FK60_9GAMM|nr:hypothetical protein [Shewanella electrica]MCH1924162.1 hypothetical protein [Shewanella electrica]MCS4556065.1 hypothetical protein [Shewanella electrica]
MKRSKKINAIMYKLLIEKEMDAFSIIEARDALLQTEATDLDANEARKQVYRHISLFQRNGWLNSIGSGRQKRFYVTDEFRELSVVSKKDTSAASYRRQKQCSKNNKSEYSVLVKERKEHEGELKIVLGEIDEYRTLQTRFPALEDTIAPLLQRSKLRSAELLGKVNVLTNVLKSLSIEEATC